VLASTTGGFRQRVTAAEYLTKSLSGQERHETGAGQALPTAKSGVKKPGLPTECEATFAYPNNANGGIRHQYARYPTILLISNLRRLYDTQKK